MTIPDSTSLLQRVFSRDPVDVATGEVLLSQTDLALPGLLPLMVERTHISSYRIGQWFGPSWASSLDQRLEVTPQGVTFIAADGMKLHYPHPHRTRSAGSPGLVPGRDGRCGEPSPAAT